MKQKVPNVQLLLPHLFNRNNRLAEGDVQGSEGAPVVVGYTDEDIENLLLLLDEEVAKNGR